MKKMVASELTAHALVAAANLAMRDSEIKDGEGLTGFMLTVASNRLCHAIPLAYALYRNMTIEVDNDLGYAWTVEYSVVDVSGNKTFSELVYNDGC